MNQAFSAISERIDRQIEKRLAQKKGIRKKCKSLLERFRRRIGYVIFTNSKDTVKRYRSPTPFGADEFGRDVADGISKYIELLKDRGLIVHTVIVLGSRVKGSWKPSSDIDVTIVAENLPEKGKSFLSRIFELERHNILSDAPLFLGIEPSGCCSKERFLQRLREFDIQMLDAVIYGKVVYDVGFWPEVKKQFDKMKRRYGLRPVHLRQKLAKI